MIIVSGVCKPSSVLDGHLSRPAVASRLKRLPGSATGRRFGFAADPRACGRAVASLSILHQVGFTARTSRQAAGELLPRLSTLALDSRKRIDKRIAAHEGTADRERGISLLHFP